MAKSVAWQDAPEIGIPERPSVFSDSDSLWVAYETPDRLHAVLEFLQVIDYWFSPINDEGLGQHPYARTGLRFYTVHEVEQSPEAQRWSAVGAKHWILTFKDNTLDVVARGAAVRARAVEADRPSNALLQYLHEQPR